MKKKGERMNSLLVTIVSFGKSLCDLHLNGQVVVIKGLYYKLSG